MSNRAILDKRDQTQAHYDKYPFRFDQRAIVDEKMENRLMGAAIPAPVEARQPGVGRPGPGLPPQRAADRRRAWPLPGLPFVGQARGIAGH